MVLDKKGGNTPPAERETASPSSDIYHGIEKFFDELSSPMLENYILRMSSRLEEENEPQWYVLVGVITGDATMEMARKMGLEERYQRAIDTLTDYLEER